MDYGLRKRLWDAGFPKLKKPHCGGCECTLDNSCDISLSELIEACGDKFIYLSKYLNRWSAKGKTHIISEMSSAEEAVAYLYLALNKK